MRKFLIALIILLAFGGGIGYWLFLMDNIAPSETRPFINIPIGSKYQDVVNLLSEKHILTSIKSFDLAASIKGYRKIKPGHYVFTTKMNNREIINMLQSGKQTPVKLVIYNIRLKEEFAGLVGRTLEIDSVAFLAKLNDPAFAANYGLDTDNILCHFLTDNYEFKWNTHIDEFVARMDQEYDKYWQGARLAKATNLGYKPSDIITLASIVEKECIFDKELPTVASVYLNRLRINMPLQADPTLLFAMRDFTAHRVTNKHKDYPSPYNLNKHTGLPPGPICMPKKKSIEAVLDPEQTDFIYFCANPDMSGYSIFSKTLEEQNKVANMYHKKLDKMNVH
ncbi:MAG: Endolytic murein transglycosylase [Bacteroidetes bacterium]|nr:Endolytic murein transglycosylase [Bacteroidota bacterium]